MKRKIFITFITLVLIGIITTGVLALNLYRMNHLYSIEERLITNSKLIREFLYSLDEVNYDEISELYSDNVNARITFIDRTGKVIGDSKADIRFLENHKDRPEIKKALKGYTGISQRFSESLGYDMLYVAIPFNKKGSDLAVIRLSVPLVNIINFNRALLKYMAISVGAGLLVALILGIRYVNNVTKPIQQLTVATKKISQGDYGERVYFKTEDELGILAENFNTMSEKLRNTINELQDSNTKMRAILSSMINGVIALDNYKRIVFLNKAAEEMFGLDTEKVKGKHLLEVVRNNVLDELIQKLLAENKRSKQEIEVHEPRYRILNIHSNPITLKDNPNRKIGVLIIIEDVTEIRKLERLRKDFVANVSHELKTPLTSIKGFIETLKEGAVENKKVRNKFLDIIDIETGRLTALIEDLLMLSEIENKHQMAEMEEIDVNKSVGEVIQILNEIAKSKDIELINNVEENIPKLYGKRTWFKQMLINLIDNGIKYTPAGGKVEVIGYRTNDFVIIKVRDTGIGIEKKHLSRLFERFYRVDKARSRQVGGTGLGLAIVKHIVLSFKGKIDVTSEVNKGTEFKITLPVKKTDK
ncbi:two-component system histidine kinase PnpS [Thermohalobacter berrensis]|uniref:histidine kinase n=1 Tax=Thermohalobacter berrensis TaxID=99594 RepID=A0A419TA03_9FIRM|nr:ATP-binding protein [Thermohalobacter berrensis]RKD34314.1 PAS domain-containing sensor histidine kinase [Thermohalobacter berrensis]